MHARLGFLRRVLRVVFVVFRIGSASKRFRRLSSRRVRARNDVVVVPERLDGVRGVSQIGERDAVAPERALVRQLLGRLVVRLERLRGGGALHAAAEQLVRVALSLALGVARVRPQRRERREHARAPAPRAQARRPSRRLVLGGGERGAPPPERRGGRGREKKPPRRSKKRQRRGRCHRVPPRGDARAEGGERLRAPGDASASAAEAPRQVNATGEARRCAAAALAAARAAEAAAKSAETDDGGAATTPPRARARARATAAAAAGAGADANKSATPRRISHTDKRRGSVKSRYPRKLSSRRSSQARAASSHARASERARARSEAEPACA